MKQTQKQTTGESVRGSKNPRWKGANTKTHSLHSWINDNFTRPLGCEICGTTTAKQYDWSNKDHKYSRIREEWQYVCRKCHLVYDTLNNNRKMPWSDKANGRWSTKHDKCSKCGTTTVPHGARGKCKVCYKAEYFQINKTKCSTDR